MTIGRTIVVAVGVMTALVLGYGAASQACCIYNHTDYVIHVDLDCGTACSNTWYIGPDGKECRPSKGGTVTVNITDQEYHQGYIASPCNVKVDKHGWVSVKKSGKNFITKSKREDGSIKDECTGKPW